MPKSPNCKAHTSRARKEWNFGRLESRCISALNVRALMRRRRAFSTSRRRIGFGERIDTEKASANMAEGILETRLPKLESKPEKKPEK
jgi:hypothetical protein